MLTTYAVFEDQIIAELGESMETAVSPLPQTGAPTPPSISPSYQNPT